MSRKSTNRFDPQVKPDEPRRRLFHFGPGILFALILALIIGGSAVKKEMQLRQATRTPPIIERQVVSSDQDRLGPVPEVKFLLDRQKDLKLTDEQTAKLRKLQADWERYSAPRIKQANEAAKQVDEYMSRAKGSRQTPAKQIQEHAAPVVAISGEISRERRAYWEQAVKVLSPYQRMIADSERKEDYAARQKALAEALKNR